MVPHARGRDDPDLPIGVARVLQLGETAWICDTPRALPTSQVSAPLADFAVLELAFAWLHPDSLLAVEALNFARLGLILHSSSGTSADEQSALLARVRHLCKDLGLEPSWHDLDGTLIVRAVRLQQ